VINGKLDEIPVDFVLTADDPVADIMASPGKRFLIFVVNLGVYILIFNLVVRRFMLMPVVGDIGPLVYAMPFSIAVDFLFSTEITQRLLR